MKNMLLLIFILLNTSFIQPDKEKLFKENVKTITYLLINSDVISLKSYFDIDAYKIFVSTYKTKQQRIEASRMLKGEIIDKSDNEKMISGYGSQIHLVFKNNRWTIAYWDVFSSD